MVTTNTYDVMDFNHLEKKIYSPIPGSKGGFREWFPSPRGCRQRQSLRAGGHLRTRGQGAFVGCQGTAPLLWLWLTWLSIIPKNLFHKKVRFTNSLFASAETTELKEKLCTLEAIQQCCRKVTKRWKTLATFFSPRPSNLERSGIRVSCSRSQNSLFSCFAHGSTFHFTGTSNDTLSFQKDGPFIVYLIKLFAPIDRGYWSFTKRHE